MCCRNSCNRLLWQRQAISFGGLLISHEKDGPRPGFNSSEPSTGSTSTMGAKITNSWPAQLFGQNLCPWLEKWARRLCSPKSSCLYSRLLRASIKAGLDFALNKCWQLALNVAFDTTVSHDTRLIANSLWCRAVRIRRMTSRFKVRTTLFEEASHQTRCDGAKCICKEASCQSTLLRSARDAFAATHRRVLRQMLQPHAATAKAKRAQPLHVGASASTQSQRDLSRCNGSRSCYCATRRGAQALSLELVMPRTCSLQASKLHDAPARKHMLARFAPFSPRRKLGT